MSPPNQVQVILSMQEKKAYQRAAKKSKMTLSAWCVAALNRAVGSKSDFTKVVYKKKILDSPRSTRVRIWYSKDAACKQWQKASVQACMTLPEWCRVVLGTACGVSQISKNLQRVRGTK